MAHRNQEGDRPEGAVGNEIPAREGDQEAETAGTEEYDRQQRPITHPHRGNEAQTEPQEPRELENPPQERGPRERQNDAV
ncbi:MAG: hypothetical protein WEB88_14525 [Gemmatimonadota bacterium]